MKEGARVAAVDRIAERSRADRLTLAFDRQNAWGRKGECAPRARPRSLAHQRRPRICGLLESRRDVDSIARDEELPTRPTAHRRKYLARVDADPHAEPNAVASLEPIVQALELGNHLARGMERADRVVLACRRHSPNCQDRVADVFLDGSAPGRDDRCHRAEVILQKRAHPFWVELIAEVS